MKIKSFRDCINCLILINVLFLLAFSENPRAKRAQVGLIELKSSSKKTQKTWVFQVKKKKKKKPKLSFFEFFFKAMPFRHLS